jgi:hypothetical protein
MFEDWSRLALWPRNGKLVMPALGGPVNSCHSVLILGVLDFESSDIWCETRSSSLSNCCQVTRSHCWPRSVQKQRSGGYSVLILYFPGGDSQSLHVQGLKVRIAVIQCKNSGLVECRLNIVRHDASSSSSGGAADLGVGAGVAQRRGASSGEHLQQH